MYMQWYHEHYDFDDIDHQEIIIFTVILMIMMIKKLLYFTTLQPCLSKQTSQQLQDHRIAWKRSIIVCGDRHHNGDWWWASRWYQWWFLWWFEDWHDNDFHDMTVAAIRSHGEKWLAINVMMVLEMTMIKLKTNCHLLFVIVFKWWFLSLWYLWWWWLFMMMNSLSKFFFYDNVNNSSANNVHDELYFIVRRW